MAVSVARWAAFNAICTHDGTGCQPTRSSGLGEPSAFAAMTSTALLQVSPRAAFVAPALVTASFAYSVATASASAPASVLTPATLAPGIRASAARAVAASLTLGGAGK